jgi:Ca-activated chloride channel family protein
VTGLAHAGWLPLVAGVSTLLALGLLVAARREGVRRRALLGSAPRLPGALRDLVLWTALAAIGAALLGPQLGQRSELVSASGVDLVVLLDVSRSMDARDVAPSRLERARRNVEQVLTGLEPGDRAALAIYASQGALLTPLSTDRTALLEMLPSLDGELMRYRGSHLGDGVRAALGAYDAASARPRLLLVLGDGEELGRSEDGGKAAAEAAAAGVRILAVALGSEAGATIPDRGVPLRTASGDIVQTRRHGDRLAALAAPTGGRLLATDAFGAIDSAAAVREIRRDAAAAPGETVVRRVPAIQVLPFAALAFLLLCADLLPPRARRSARERSALRPAAALLCAALAAGGATAGAQSEDEAVAVSEARALASPMDPVTLLRLGVARARAGLGAEAERALLAAALYARNPQLASMAYFDLGVTALERGALEAARDAFFDALALAPGDDEARFNLEWTLRALREPSLPPPPAPGDGQAGEASTARLPGASGSDAGADSEPQPDDSAADRGAAKGERSAAQREKPSGDDEAARAAAEGEADARAPAPALTPEEASRWLGAVEDDPGRALRDTARAAADGGRRSRREPLW